MAKTKFTRLPKANELVDRGVPREVLPTLWKLADYASNRNGMCWPEMATIASALRVSVRTVQRHIDRLEEVGVLKRVKRRRTWRGRYSSWLYCLVFFAGFTTGHGSHRGKGRPYSKGSKRGRNDPPISSLQSNQDNSPPSKGSGDFKEGYEWWFA